MVELDHDIAAVWQAILGNDAEWLGERIVSFDLTVESVKVELALECQTVRDRAFRTILKNRVYHGGIMAHGSSMIRHGENGKGIKSRWYASTLRRRIQEISDVRHQIEFIEGDGLAVIERFTKQKNVAVFIDPPYTAAGKKAGSRLYRHNELDHEHLFEITAALKGDFLMTYDNTDGVKQMAERHGFDTELVAMKNTHHAKMMELLIGKDLSWARRSPSKTNQATLFD
jgi:DNA adenine methylase